MDNEWCNMIIESLESAGFPDAVTILIANDTCSLEIREEIPRQVEALLEYGLASMQFVSNILEEYLEYDSVCVSALRKLFQQYWDIFLP